MARDNAWKWFATPDPAREALPAWMTEPTQERPIVTGRRSTPLFTPLAEQRCTPSPVRPR